MHPSAHGGHDHDSGGVDLTALTSELWLAALLVLAVAGYVGCVRLLRRRGIAWPLRRTVSWIAGWLAAGAALVGPLAEQAHHDFAAHMATHVLLGMVAPLLLVLAAPATLALRVLPTRRARLLARMLGSRPLSVLTDPFLAGLLNVGGLWILYRTDLYGAMQAAPAIHVLVHVHVLAAGYLFTFAVLGGPDPAPHRPSPARRVTALVLAIAAHNILAKTLYADPPAGVPADQARAGAELMYYGGAPIEIALIVLVCTPWLLPRRRRPTTVGV